MKSKKLKLGQIDLEMCKDYDLIQAMDYDFKMKEVMNKGRGFAVTVVKIQGLTFLIPFRSYIPKKYQLKYKLRNSAKEGYVEGLDIGKTLILEDKSYLLNTTFRLRKIEDYYKVMDNDKVIINKLVKAIIDYNHALEINDRNKLEDPKRFKFSTFQNYSTRLKVITEKDYLEQMMFPQVVWFAVFLLFKNTHFERLETEITILLFKKVLI